jgi:D-alanyl-D-alanine carboxypeptidase
MPPSAVCRNLSRLLVLVLSVVPLASAIASGDLPAAQRSPGGWLPPGGPPSALPASWAPAATDVERIRAVLDETRRRYHVPAMAAAVMQDGQVVVGAAGVRMAGRSTAVTEDDLFHLGSCGKAMTATLGARLVEQGVLGWDTKFLDLFPELQGEIRPDYQEVTLEQLLTMRGGVRAQLPDRLTQRILAFRGTPEEGRLKFLRPVLSLRPDGEPGITFSYSNASYVVAAAMLERATGRTFEELIEEQVFQPLGMTTPGFGAPGQRGLLDQPRGHTRTGEPVAPGPRADNPPLASPAGRMHMSLADWARFVAVHLDEGGALGYLKPETLQHLHEPYAGPGLAYAFGWAVDDSGGERVLLHDGTNTLWFTLVVASPGRKVALLVADNRGGRAGWNAVLAAATALDLEFGLDFAILEAGGAPVAAERDLAGPAPSFLQVPEPR